MSVVVCGDDSGALTRCATASAARRAPPPVRAWGPLLRRRGQRPEEHDHAPQPVRVAALDDVDPLQDDRPVDGADHPGIARKAVVLVQAARERQPCPRKARAEARDPLADRGAAREATAFGSSSSASLVRERASNCPRAA